MEKGFQSPGQTPVDYTYIGQKLTQVSDALANETHTYGYDSSYRLNHETHAGRGEINYSYDAGDRLSEYAVVGGPTAGYQYYPDGSVQSIQWSRIPGEFDFTYRLDGRYQQIQMPNGQHRDFLFDDQGRLTEIANIHPTAGNLATYDYGYDVDYNAPPASMLGQRTSLTATVPSQGMSGSLTKYYFDSAYQLTETDYPNVAPFNGEADSWSYDSIGNRLSAAVNGNGVSYTYPANSELLSSVGTTTFNYNGNRSLVAETGFSLQWDVRNKLASINSGVDATYSYDFRGRRFAKTVSGVASMFLYAGQNLIAQTTGSATSEFLFAPGIDKPLAAYTGGTAYYYSVDGLGSMSLLTDAAGTVQDSYVYDVWGRTLSQTVNVPQPFVYTAREAGERGLLYYRARYYDPSIGRFISEDPVRYADFSLYPYAGNDPVSFIDPWGYSQDKYVVDMYKHGGPHMDRYDKHGNNVGRYDEDGNGLDEETPRVPNSDKKKFQDALDKLREKIKAQKDAEAKRCPPPEETTKNDFSIPAVPINPSTPDWGQILDEFWNFLWEPTPVPGIEPLPVPMPIEPMFDPMLEPALVP